MTTQMPSVISASSVFKIHLLKLNSNDLNTQFMKSTEPFGVNSAEKSVWSLMRLLRFFVAKWLRQKKLPGGEPDSL